MGEIIDALNNLTKDRNAGQMLSFFKTLKQWKKKFDAMFFVSRKGYWTYQLLKKYDKSIYMDHVYSDRYLLKAIGNKMFKDKKICLIDDTMSTGFRLFRYYCILSARGAKKIIPAVYSQSIEYPQQSELERMIEIYYHVNHIENSSNEDELKKAKTIRREFLRKLYCEQYLAQGNISKLCMLETEVQQSCLCPQAIDLPMLISKKDGNVLEDEFVFSKRQFEKLCVENDEWLYVRNVYDIKESKLSDYTVQGELMIPIQCNYFECQEGTLKRLYHSILLSGVVKCKYNIDEKGKYHILFTPFAITRSWDKNQLKEMFQQLFYGTDYYKKLVPKMEHDIKVKDDSVWISVSHALVFGISLYIGEKFKKHLCECLNDMVVSYDWSIMKDSSDNDFIKAMQEIISDIDRRIVYLAEYCEKNILDSNIYFDKGRTLRYSLSEGYEAVYSLILQIWNESEEHNTIEIEKIENILQKRYNFPDETAMRKGVVSIILLFLEINVFGNYLNVQENKIVRSFRCGENSGLLLMRAGKMCYALAEILYFVKGKEAYYESAEAYFNNIEDYLKRENIFEEYVTESDYKKYIEWFINEDIIPSDKLHGHIMGKQFLLKNIDDTLEKIRQYAMHYAEQS